ncbi:MAG: DUF1566 domain-containing protein [Sandaracinaceae bacterium]|nr:DUF1566 domain-containing protein [Sandaracinaceae bacterium]
MKRALVIMWLCMTPGCGRLLDLDQYSVTDAGPGGDASVDADTQDAGMDDAGPDDASVNDAATDAGPNDLGAQDGALADMGPSSCRTLNGGCDPLTACDDTSGQVVCGPCPSGYEGDGFSGCLGVDVCAAPSRCAGTDATSGVSYAYACEVLTFPAYRCEGLDVEWPVDATSRFDIARYRVDVGPDAVSGSADDTVVDALTGLEWQRTASTTNESWSDAATTCADLTIGGGGWRLPEQVELESVIDVRGQSPAIDTTAFPGTPAARFWSASPFVGAAGEIWFTNFANGFTDTATAATTMWVRCVRRIAAPPRPASSVTRFATTASTATDGITGLEWARATASPRSWTAAVDHCTSLGGWRLPTRAELLSLVTRTATSPAIDRDAFPTTPLDWYWTASSSMDDTRAHIVNFGSGLTSQALKSEAIQVRCVR